MAFGMLWQVGWSLVLGFAISAVLQAVVSKQTMSRARSVGRAFARSRWRRLLGLQVTPPRRRPA